MLPILKCIFLFARVCTRKGNLIVNGRGRSRISSFRFRIVARWMLCTYGAGERPARCKQKRARRAKCTAECRTFRRKNANEQIAPRNWDGSPKPRNTRRQRPAITAFLFRVTLVRYAKIKQEIWLYPAFNCGARFPLGRSIIQAFYWDVQSSIRSKENIRHSIEKMFIRSHN